MKLITAMVQDEDTSRLISFLMTRGYRATKISSTGGFLRRGNTTLMLGVEDDEVEAVIDIIKECCRKRKLLMNLDPSGPIISGGEVPFPLLTPVEVGGAVIFVSEIERFERV